MGRLSLRAVLTQLRHRRQHNGDDGVAGDKRQKQKTPTPTTTATSEAQRYHRRQPASMQEGDDAEHSMMPLCCLRLWLWLLTLMMLKGCVCLFAFFFFTRELRENQPHTLHEKKKTIKNGVETCSINSREKERGEREGVERVRAAKRITAPKWPTHTHVGAQNFLANITRKIWCFVSR